MVNPVDGVHGVHPVCPEQQPGKSQSRHESKMYKAVKAEFRESSQKPTHLTMGEDPVQLPGPEQFLRKKTREVKFQQRAKSARAHRDRVKDCEERRPPVPRVTDHVATPLRRRRNFVAKNTLDVMIAPARQPDDPQYVDAPDGHAQSLVQSGLVPVHSSQKTFGRIPAYLQKLRQSREEEMARWEEQKRRDQEAMENMRLSDKDREAILHGLKQNWSEIHFQYQKLSLFTDTLPKKIRREQIEAQMDQLERFVALIEQHPVIIIADETLVTLNNN